MKELYFLSIIGNIHTASVIITGLCLLALLILILSNFEEDFYEDTKSRVHSYVKRIFIIGCISLIMSIIIPSKKELYLIYGGSSVIEAVQDNEDVKKIPSNVVKVLNSWLEKYIEDSKEVK